MRTRTAAASILLAASLTACGTTPAPDKPAATSSAAPKVDKAATVKACVDAVAELPAGPDGSVPSDPVPTECTDLSDSEYLDAYMDGISQANREGIADLEQQIEDAAEQ